MFSPVRDRGDNFITYYPFANSRAGNVLEHYSNKPDGTKVNVKLLFLGCGDVKNALEATNSKHIKTFEIHLNDVHPSVLARNIAILKIISSETFNPEKEGDIAFLWDVWYNLAWPEKTRARFQIVVNELLEAMPVNIEVPNSSQLEELKQLWRHWQSILLYSKLQSTFIFEATKLKRLEKKKNLIKRFAKHAFIAGLHASIHERACKEAEKYFVTGRCQPHGDRNCAFFNPTMMDSMNKSWENGSSSPFEQYFPLFSDELETSSLTLSCQKILKSVVSTYRGRIKDIVIFLHLEDAINFCYSDMIAATSTVETFDVIHCSNLTEQIRFPNLLPACNRKLSEKQEALLFTDVEYCHFSAYHYIQDEVRCPLSSIPTLYGLRQADHVELGNTTYGIPFRVLCWQKAPKFQNIMLNQSDIMFNGWQIIFGSDCYEDGIMSTVDQERAVNYTPLTMNYIGDYMIRNLGGNFWSPPFDIDFKFHLAQRTLTAWKTGQTILQYSSTLRLYGVGKVIPVVNTKKSLQRIFRLVLHPKTYMFSWDARCQKDVHFIDNFQLKVTNPHVNCEEIFLCFHLVVDHGLRSTHVASVVDCNDFKTVFIFDCLNTMEEENWNRSYILQPMPVVTLAECSQITVHKYFEDEKKYELKIFIGSGPTSNLRVTPQYELPCESCHGITFSHGQDSEMKPLTVSFAHPVRIEKIQWTSSADTSHVDISLPKALLEPWPCEFRANYTKWKVEDMKFWEEKSTEPLPSTSSSTSHSFSSLQYHLQRQHEICCHLTEHQTWNGLDTEAFFKVRLFFQSLLSPSSAKFRYKISDHEIPNDWIQFKIHKSIHTSPLGSPLRAVSVFDYKHLTFLKNQMQVTEKMQSEYEHVIQYCLPEAISIPFKTSEFEILRFVLRLNSTKIERSVLQGEEAFLPENRFWVTSFISPLYADTFANEFIDKETESGSSDMA